VTRWTTLIGSGALCLTPWRDSVIFGHVRNERLPFSGPHVKKVMGAG
jgi:hypothetical protein